jgi:hypothetical protein
VISIRTQIQRKGGSTIRDAPEPAHSYWREGAREDDLEEVEQIDRAIAELIADYKTYAAAKHMILSRCVMRAKRAREKAAKKHGGG